MELLLIHVSYLVFNRQVIPACFYMPEYLFDLENYSYNFNCR